MKVFLFVLILLIATITAGFAWYGGMKKIEFHLAHTGGEVFVYESYTGDYKHTGEIMDRIYFSLLNDENIETFRGAGIYYDDPAKTKTNLLRSDIGCILEDPDPELLEKLSEKYSIKRLPENTQLITRFPYNGKFSIFIGIMRVYPAMNKHVKANGYPEDGYVIEIYDVPGKFIEYRKNI